MNWPISRRAFACDLVALAGAVILLGANVESQAQQRAAPQRIGVLLGIGSPESREVGAFRRGLEEAGYVEGRDLQIEWRSAGGDFAKVPEMVADLLRQDLDVIVVTTTIAAQEVRRATSTIPTVFVVVGDPIGSGLVAGLAHPGGNITGLSNMSIEVSAKRLQLLKDAFPTTSRVTVLWNPATPYHAAVIDELKAVAATLAFQLAFIGTRDRGQLIEAFGRINRRTADALYVIHDNFFHENRKLLMDLTTKARLPAIHPARQFVDVGGLMSYGASIEDQMRRSAGYVDKILRGAKPGDLPIEQPTKLEFIVNLKSAKALGIEIPESILQLADEVIR